MANEREHLSRREWMAKFGAAMEERKRLAEMLRPGPRPVITMEEIGNEIAQKQMTGMSTRENNYAGNNYSWHFRPEEYGGEKYDPKFGWMLKMHKEQHQ